MKALREACAIPGGIAAALFGRMVTSDVEANVDAAVHVAHAFTVHSEESESDYFTVVDDLQRTEDDAGADHIGETELTSGLFYGYVVLDRGTLLDNLGGDTEMAGAVAARLVHLIATVSPGAKLGPTAPYGYASWVLVEAGDRQPRSLAEAFREPCKPATKAVAEKAREYLEKDPGSLRAARPQRWLPRTRGDGPRQILLWDCIVTASPHTRGWTRDCLPGPESDPGFPAHAGMDPPACQQGAPDCGLPRTRGDGPWRLTTPASSPPASPHTRGWTPRTPDHRLVGRGFPAHAGMDPGTVALARLPTRLPRTRGDGPWPASTRPKK